MNENVKHAMDIDFDAFKEDILDRAASLDLGGSVIYDQDNPVSALEDPEHEGARMRGQTPRGNDNKTQELSTRPRMFPYDLWPTIYYCKFVTTSH